jgi:hypothetical protein
MTALRFRNLPSAVLLNCNGVGGGEVLKLAISPQDNYRTSARNVKNPRKVL